MDAGNKHQGRRDLNNANTNQLKSRTVMTYDSVNEHPHSSEERPLDRDGDASPKAQKYQKPPSETDPLLGPLNHTLKSKSSHSSSLRSTTPPLDSPGSYSKFSTSLKAWANQNYGFLLILSAQVFFALMNVFVKLLSLTTEEGDKPVPTWELIMARMGVTWLGCVVYMWWSGIKDPFLGPKDVRGLLVLRGVVGFFGLFGVYFSLGYLSLSDATVLTFLIPILTGILAVPVLKESYSMLEASAAVASLAGVVLIAKPEFLFGHYMTPNSFVEPLETSMNGTWIGILNDAAIILDSLNEVTPEERLLAVAMSMMGVCGAAAAYLTIRTIGYRASPLHSTSYFALYCVIVSGFIPMFTDSPPVMPRPPFFAMLIAIGVMGFAAQILLAMGLQREKAGRGASAMYSQAIFAVVLEKLVFGTTPDWWSVLGSSIIVGGALMVAFRKSQGSPAVTDKGRSLGKENLLESGRLEDGEVQEEERNDMARVERPVADGGHPN